VQPQVAHPLHKLAQRGTSKQYCVWMNSAPASIFLARRSGRQSNGGANGLEAAPRKSGGGTVSLRPLKNTPSSRMMRAVRSSWIESRSKTRLASGWSPGHVVAGEAEHVAHAHRRRAQQVALDGDAVAVAAGDLEDGS
jgi:hypothetical protein